MAQFIYHASRGRTSRRRLIVASIAVVLVLFIDTYTGQHLRAGVRSIGTGVWNATSHVRSSIRNTGYFSTHRSLAEENAALRAEIELMHERASGYDSVKQENDELRRMLHLTQEQQGVAAPITSSIVSSPYGSFMLGAGSAEGISVGNLVVTAGGYVVGVVKDTGDHVALVREIFAGGVDTDASIHGSAVSVKGHGGGNARAELPRGVDVAVGDVVVAPTLRSRPIGIVGKVDSDPARASQIAYIHLPVNISSIRFVYVIPQ